jgi:hypothetical protein
MDIINITVEKTLRTLIAVGAKYIVVMPDGTQHTHGDLELAAPPKKRAITQRGEPRRVRGELKCITEPFLKGMQVGDVVVVPSQANLPMGDLVKSLSSRGFHMYGQGGITVMHNKKTNCVEILRLA